MPATNDYAVIITTTNSADHAEQLARKLVDSRLAACVQVQPIRSFYRWKGEVCADAELLLLIKSRSELFGQLERVIKANHAYETPEIVQLPITAGSAEYLRWVDEATR